MRLKLPVTASWPRTMNSRVAPAVLRFNPSAASPASAIVPVSVLTSLLAAEKPTPAAFPAMMTLAASWLVPSSLDLDSVLTMS